MVKQKLMKPFRSDVVNGAEGAKKRRKERWRTEASELRSRQGRKEKTSQVRLEWEAVEGIDEAYVANTRCVQIMVDGLFGHKGVLECPSKPWLGFVSGRVATSNT